MRPAQCQVDPEVAMAGCHVNASESDGVGRSHGPAVLGCGSGRHSFSKRNRKSGSDIYVCRPRSRTLPLAELQISIHLRASLLLVLYIQKELQTFPTQRHNRPRHLLNTLPLKKFVCTFTIVDDARCLRRPARIRIVLLEQRLP